MNIKLDNITFKYDDEAILKDFNLEIKSNSIVALIGHNGSGKSTIAKLIVGLLAPQKGSIYLDNELLDDESIKHLRNKLGIIFQNPDNQFVGVTVKDDVAFGLENRCLERDEIIARIDKYLKLVGMQDYIDASPDELSGGQKQRVAIAGALATECELLILDESTSMLDPLGTKEVGETIKKIREEDNKTIIIITHDLEEALIADRIIVLNKGKIVLDGVKEEVFKREDILTKCGLKTLDSISILNEVKNLNYPNKEKVEEALWELTFKK